jgi:putative ABC transport system permease protein
MTVTVGDRRFYERIAVVDPTFFEAIKLPLVEGDPANVFTQPESIVLSKSAAKKYFGADDPVGKLLTVTGNGDLCDRNDSSCLAAVHPLTVTGVLRDLPHNTQLAADFLLPNTSVADEMPPWYRDQSWTSTDGGFAYIALAPGAQPNAVLSKLNRILDRSIDTHQSGQDMRGSEFERFRLTRFCDAHLTSDQYGGMRPPGNWTTVYGFTVIAALIILIASFNFMNLATARATLRAREISLRKVVGARRRQLIVQFLGEALFMAMFSLALALAWVEILLPAFDNLLAKPIEFHYVAN